MIRRFTHTQNGHYKFWEVAIDEPELGPGQVRVRYGRIGTKGQERVVDHGSDRNAVSVVQGVIWEKRDKGYVEENLRPKAEEREPAVRSSVSIAINGKPLPPIERIDYRARERAEAIERGAEERRRNELRRYVEPQTFGVAQPARRKTPPAPPKLGGLDIDHEEKPAAPVAPLPKRDLDF